MNTKTIIVTGASSGIGKEIARHFLSRGYQVLINSKTQAKLQQAYESLGGGKRLAMLAGDLAEKTTGIQLAEKAMSTFGSLDILVNNAGIFETRPFLQVDEAYLDSFLNTNLKGSFYTSQAVIPHMLSQGAGCIINIGSPLVTHGIGDVPCTAPLVSKAGIHTLTIQLAAEFGRQNIRVNTIAPGVIRTPMHGGREESSKGLHVLQRIGETTEIAEMAWTITQSTFITGAIINVDGGMGSAHYLNNH